MITRSLITFMLMTTPALSADLVHAPQHEPVYKEAAAAVNWTGLRLGIHAGITHSSADAMRGEIAGPLINLDVYNGLFPDRMSENTNSFAGGIDGGFDYQIGGFVFGIAGDLTFSNVEASNKFSRIDPNPNPPFSGVTTNTSYDTTIDYIATARMRMGYAMDKTLIYATAGFATAEVENRFSLNIPELAYDSPNWHEKGNQNGVVIGAGIEHQITENWRFGFELQHIDLEDVTVNGVDEATFPGEAIAYKFSNDLVLARFGLAYAF